jgi:hypothetical protein
MSHRDRHHQKLLVPAVIEQKGDMWNESTRTLALSDAQRVLEALIAEYGVDATVKALDNQGIAGKSYLYLIRPLHAEAARRRHGAEADELEQDTAVRPDSEDAG